MREGLGPRGDDRGPDEGRGGDGGVVEHAVDDHLGDVRVGRDGVARELGERPGELSLAGERHVGRLGPHLVADAHAPTAGGVTLVTASGSGAPGPPAAWFGPAGTCGVVGCCVVRT
ncbi:hypothetical protein CCE01nite_39900 [Cellulomonas cellasea]|uniref:Uncharacterized protein n=1 Tax=Cellulomonas cellasea TaxID=43670 RepID=A0A4Y3KZW3_9CELL|nr:hypothetical protein CCE01nite_39900 [Cellulomonas cellasea]